MNQIPIKCVKESTFIEDKGIYTCIHYQTVIFEASEQGLIKLNCPSPTSSRMAKRCYEYVFKTFLMNQEWKKLKEQFS